MIELKGLAKSYGSHAALQATNLTVPAEKTTALIGPSGCGKSTILRLIAGLIEPSQGSVVIGGESMSPETALSLRRKLGYVIQDGGLFPHLTARENVTVMADHLRMYADEQRRKLSDLLQLTRFPEELMNRYPGELSGGQKQRVGLMRALMLDPEVLLLDEPLGALDPMVRADLQTDLKSIFAALSKTVLLVTHDMGEAAYLADRIVLLKEGAIVQEGELRDFQVHPAEPFVTDFLHAQRSMVAV